MLLRNRRLEGQDGGGSPNPNPGLERGGTGGHPRNLSPRNSGWRNNFPFTWGYRNMLVFNPPQKNRICEIQIGKSYRDVLTAAPCLNIMGNSYLHPPRRLVLRRIPKQREIYSTTLDCGVVSRTAPF